MTRLSLARAVPEGGSLDRLRQAARTLFVQRGYHETRPQDIARLAGVANGTFYLHFGDKQQAFLDFAEQAQNELLYLMSERLRSVHGRRDRWRETIGALMDFNIGHPGLLQAAFVDPVFVAPRDDNAWQMYDRLGHLVSVALEREAAPGYDLTLISHGICGMLRHAMTYAGRSQLDRQKMIEDLSRFIDSGLVGALSDQEEDT
jgi:AcrR family transcriptional regulator